MDPLIKSDEPGREIEQKPDVRIKSGRKSLELFVGHCWFGGEFFSTVWAEDLPSSYSKGRKGSPQIDGDTQMAKDGALGEAVLTGKLRMEKGEEMLKQGNSTAHHYRDRRNESSPRRERSAPASAQKGHGRRKQTIGLEVEKVRREPGRT